MQELQEMFLARGDHPSSRKNSPRMEGQIKIFHVGSHQFQESLRELLRELWFSCCSSHGMPFRERNLCIPRMEFRIPRVAPRIPRNSPRAPRMAFSLRERFSMPSMTGRPGHRTMEMNGGSSVPYLACTPCVPLLCTLFNRGGNRIAFSLPGAGRGSLPLYGGTFARSYSVWSFSWKWGGPQASELFSGSLRQFYTLKTLRENLQRVT